MARGYHHGNLRRALLDAALEVVAERGPNGISMSALARAAGVSSGAPYRHFKSADAVLAAIAAEGWARLMAEERAQTADVEAPLERFRRAGIATVRFAVSHPTHFRLMFGPHGRRLDDPELSARIAEADARTQQMVDAAIAAGEMGGAEAAMLAAQAMIYGLARLFVDGALAPVSPDEAEHLTVAATEVLGSGLIPRGGVSEAPDDPDSGCTSG